jgi:hypothetical protein
MSAEQKPTKADPLAELRQRHEQSQGIVADRRRVHAAAREKEAALISQRTKLETEFQVAAVSGADGAVDQIAADQRALEGRLRAAAIASEKAGGELRAAEEEAQAHDRAYHDAHNDLILAEHEKALADADAKLRSTFIAFINAGGERERVRAGVDTVRRHVASVAKGHFFATPTLAEVLRKLEQSTVDDVTSRLGTMQYTSYAGFSIPIFTRPIS